MRIAQVAPLFESVPPKKYGGTERVVSYLTEELVRMGHDVTLFASGDSVTEANLASQCDRSLRLDENCVDSIAHHVLMVEHVAAQADRFDIIHWHIDYFPYSTIRRLKTPSITTLHGRLNLPDLVPLYEEFNDIQLVSISNAQRRPIPSANWQGTVYHGVPENLYTPQKKSGDYLIFLGRISPEKRVDLAIEIARRAGLPLIVAAKVDAEDRKYFEATIKPLMEASKEFVKFVGEVGGPEKRKLLADAQALVFAIDWPEPFGLVMIEAMACGTPVVAFRRGSVSEVIDEGKTGFIVDSIEEAVAAVKKIPSINREQCRRIFEKRFTAARMASDYVKIYESLMKVKQS